MTGVKLPLGSSSGLLTPSGRAATPASSHKGFSQVEGRHETPSLVRSKTTRQAVDLPKTVAEVKMQAAAAQAALLTIEVVETLACVSTAL